MTNDQSHWTALLHPRVCSFRNCQHQTMSVNICTDIDGSVPSHPDNRFWDCSITSCPRAAAIDLGGCERCSQHYCVSHVDSTLHPCSKDPLDDNEWSVGREDELRRLRDMINIDELRAVASAARGETECTLSLDTDQVLMGGMHVHFPVEFSDGVVWLARIPRHTNFQSFSVHLSDELLLSECATLKWLEQVKIPAPKLGGYGLKGDPKNPVGVAFMLIERLPGHPFDGTSATEGQRKKVYGQLSEALASLSNHPFDRIGSLTLATDGSLLLGPVVGDRTGTLSRLGPFNVATTYYVAWAEEYMRLVADGQLFGNFSVTAYLIFKHLRHLAASQGLCPDGPSQLDSGPFFLKHTDDKGDHIMVDDDFNVTGIIDWSFARSVPAYEAFGPSLVTADLGSLLDGKTGLSPEDLLLSTLSGEKIVPHGRFASYPDRARRFLFGPGTGMGPTEEEAVAIFKGIVETFGQQIGSWEAWRQEQLSQPAGDEVLRSLVGRGGGVNKP